MRSEETKYMLKCTILSMYGMSKRGLGRSSDGMTQRTKMIIVHKRLIPRISVRLEDMGYSSKIRTVIFTSVRGRSCLSVGRVAILSMTSKPSMTSPNTVYSPSKWGHPPTER